MNNSHEFCLMDDRCAHKKPDDCMRCYAFDPLYRWKGMNTKVDIRPRMLKFDGRVTQYYRPELTVEEPDFSKDPFEAFHKAVMEQQVKAIDTLDQKMVEACIKAAQEEGVCLTLLDKKFIVDAIREKMERDGLMDE